MTFGAARDDCGISQRLRMLANLCSYITFAWHTNTTDARIRLCVCVCVRIRVQN